MGKEQLQEEEQDKAGDEGQNRSPGKGSLNVLKIQLFDITYFVLQVKGEPSSSSSHVVLQRLQARRQGEETELPRIGEEDIDNVIGSREYSASLKHVPISLKHVQVSMRHLLASLKHVLAELGHVSTSLGHYLVSLRHLPAVLKHVLASTGHVPTSLRHVLLSLTHHLALLKHV